MSNIQDFAVEELKRCGYQFDEDGYPVEDPDDEFDINAEMCMCVMEVLEVFEKQGHSGMSASYAISILEKVMRFEPLTPLTGDDDEWNDVSEFGDGSPNFQNKRCSHVFKDAEGVYDIDGKIFIDPDGGSYTNTNSRVPVEFPYTPKRIYMNVDEEGNELGEREA